MRRKAISSFRRMVEYLMEVFDTQDVVFGEPTKFSDAWEIYFQVGGRYFQFSATAVNSYTWRVLFKDDSEGAEKGGFGITGKGGQFKVFGAVLQCMRLFISDMDPKRMVFSASTSEPSRVRLYRTMVSRMASPLGYVYREEKKVTAVFFVLMKKGYEGSEYDDDDGSDDGFIADRDIKMPPTAAESLEEVLSTMKGITFSQPMSEDEHDWRCYFWIDDRRFIFSAFGYSDNWEVAFKDDQADTYSSGFKITGKGDAYRIFSAVLECLRRLDGDVNPSIITFSADSTEPSRVRLYRTMIRRLAAPLGFDYDEEESSMNVYFRLIRKAQAVESFESLVNSIVEENDWMNWPEEDGYDKETTYQQQDVDWEELKREVGKLNQTGHGKFSVSQSGEGYEDQRDSDQFILYNDGEEVTSGSLPELISRMKQIKKEMGVY